VSGKASGKISAIKSVREMQMEDIVNMTRPKAGTITENQKVKQLARDNLALM